MFFLQYVEFVRRRMLMLCHVLLTNRSNKPVLTVSSRVFPRKVDQARHPYIGKRHGAVEQETGKRATGPKYIQGFIHEGPNPPLWDQYVCS